MVAAMLYRGMEESRCSATTSSIGEEQTCNHNRFLAVTTANNGLALRMRKKQRSKECDINTPDVKEE